MNGATGEEGEGHFLGPVQPRELGDIMGFERARGREASRWEWKCHKVKWREPEIQELCWLSSLARAYADPRMHSVHGDAADEVIQRSNEIFLKVPLYTAGRKIRSK